jgi:hypothetical protein
VVAMAAHDDEKVSDNRRRLFKALSAAPVVMTLRPGEALANNSAFQCAEKIADPDTLPNLEQYGPTPTTGFLTATLEYFLLPATIPDSCVLSSLTDDFVVPIGGALYRNLQPGDAISTGFIHNPGAGTPPAGGTLVLLDGDGNACTTIAASLGEFALLDFADGFVGVPFPKANPSTAGLQGMTGTCLCSVNPDAPYCTMTTG